MRTVVRAIASLPLRATTAEVQFESQECEQLLALFALRDASTYSSPCRKNLAFKEMIKNVR